MIEHTVVVARQNSTTYIGKLLQAIPCVFHVYIAPQHIEPQVIRPISGQVLARHDRITRSDHLPRPRLHHNGLVPWRMSWRGYHDHARYNFVIVFMVLKETPQNGAS